jgi:glycosyltransferase involved in cell wall biosynthesis
VPKPIILTGMHRSGTSLAASWLSALGVDMGQELLPADKGNPRGYFEDIGFLEFQRRLLSQCCLPNDGGHPDWGWTESEQLNRETLKDFIPTARGLVASRAAGRGLWGWKDPRTTLLLDFWDTLLDGAYYIFVYRFPWDVADGMQRLGAPVFLRNPEYAFRIWTFYNRHIRDFFIKNGHRCVLLSINALRRNPDQLVELLHNKLNLELREANLSDIYAHELFTSTEGPDGYDPLIDLVAATSSECTNLLAELDNLADLSGSGLWRARPLHGSLGAHASSVLASEARGIALRTEVEAGDSLRRPSEGNNPSSPQQVDLSVIIPCRDDGQFLIEAIASFERVAPENCELIVVDDGSTQLRTLEILQVLRDAGYCLLDQENQGLSSARNAGISIARGRYIFPLDADNRMRAGFVEAAIKILDSTPEIGIVYGYRQFFGMKTGIDEVADFDLEELLMFNYIDAGAVFRRQVWADCGGYDQRMSPLEDWDLWISAAEKGWRFHRLPQVTFDYRVRPGSLLSMVDNHEFLDQLFESLMTKHYELYQPRFVKQLAKMKRSAAHLTVGFRRLSEENDLLKAQLLAAKSEVKKIEATGVDDPAPEPEPTQTTPPAEGPADKSNSLGRRLLTYVRRAMQGRRGS